jgi:hypothetical protein
MRAGKGQFRRGGRAALLAGLFLPPTAWFVSQQGAGAYLRVDCASGGIVGGSASALALSLCALAVWIAWPKPGPAALDRFLRRLALASAAVFALGIVYQGLATAIVPSCAR